ncbi:O-methyltransferase [Sandarakinorhabdus sp. DWP1-3-1]|uniref:O-methyltransferase n=1 Tax=Sandarakinorhabdus sp. DWP1-3-1 TaxID=2804627 RepID=UPI003CF5316D
MDFAAVDDFLLAHLGGDDDVLAAALARADAAGLPAINVSAPQGKFLYLLARLVGAHRILEIGTLAGYSTLWLARGLADGGHLDTIEIDAGHADVATANFAAAGLADRITLHRGAALDVLSDLAGPYDLVFIDADKQNNAVYFDHAVRLGRPGTLIIVDNVVRGGDILAPLDEKALGTVALFAALKVDPRVEATALQLAGAKGWDGIIVARVR